MCPKSDGGYRVYSDKELESFFEIYRTSRITGTTGMPSLREVGDRCSISTKLAKRLRDDNHWETRRLVMLKQIQKKADEKRVSAEVKRIELYEGLEMAGLEFHISKVYKGKAGKKMLKLKPTDVIAFGKHVEYLKGNASDRHDVNINGNPVKVILNLGDNGMIRKNGKT